MAITTFPSRALSRHIGQVKRAARNGPVFITERRRVAYVLLSIEDYQRLLSDGEGEAAADGASP
ncbi:hypothetical protein G432_07755 [Sphingomonas sp. MM-1]|uniref:type II toxin-antitoxin system Phd/YefM family antitoxin n=1 Tax=Sphingomonas sp. MM-1 TaxID=745310 RepID=UPI0002C14F97|nr:type II toxin-antitoxin system Phd/YefM family antitoxin [Sphingomonas sp. MM-1]AGH49276.1 hypothetical protein G432_07755 [Sphingomonas sp. MM-1]